MAMLGERYQDLQWSEQLQRLVLCHDTRESAIVRNHKGKTVKLKSIDEGDVAREHQVVLNQPNDERLPHGHGELVDDAEACGDDEDEVVE
jgi:hypothetical protein